MSAWIKGLASIALVLALAGGCAGEEETSTPRGGREACELFEDVSAQQARGELTASELAVKMREVATLALGNNELIYDTGRLAQTLLNEGKTPQDAEVKRAFSDISTECDAVAASA